MPDYSLIDANDSIFLIIDVQDNFTSKLAERQAKEMVERIAWLAVVAGWLQIPVVVTVEDMPKAGGPSALIHNALPHGTPIFNKVVFGLAGQPDILEAVESQGKRTAVLVGLETDVCIMQSALGLLALRYHVVVVSDATCSPGESHANGLSRMRDAGVTISDTKGLFYEWVRTLEKARQFHRENASVRVPEGLEL